MNRLNLYTSNFKDNLIFFCKALLMLIIIGIFCFQVVMPQYLGGYNAALLDKLSRLKNVEGPKIVLLGNSNVAFGFQSETIEKELGMPVVNMGLHGGLGNAFHEKLAKINVCEGDIYIICHSDFGGDGTVLNKPLAWNAIENHFELWQCLSFKDIGAMMKEYSIYLKKCLDLWVNDSGNQMEEGIYSRQSFNLYGDIAVKREGSIFSFKSSVEPPIINDITINRINELYVWLDNKGATLLVAGYPIGKGELTAPEDEFVAAQEKLKKKLSCPFISDYRDYMYDYDLFYNTEYHLNDEGAALRTQQLIADLKNWMESEK